MPIRELTWQIKQVVLETQNFTSILPSLRPPSRRSILKNNLFTYIRICELLLYDLKYIFLLRMFMLILHVIRIVFSAREVTEDIVV